MDLRGSGMKSYLELKRELLDLLQVAPRYEGEGREGFVEAKGLGEGGGWVYIIWVEKKGRLYVGSTGDIKRRFTNPWYTFNFHFKSELWI